MTLTEADFPRHAPGTGGNLGNLLRVGSSTFGLFGASSRLRRSTSARDLDTQQRRLSGHAPLSLAARPVRDSAGMMDAAMEEEDSESDNDSGGLGGAGPGPHSPGHSGGQVYSMSLVSSPSMSWQPSRDRDLPGGAPWLAGWHGHGVTRPPRPSLDDEISSPSKARPLCDAADADTSVDEGLRNPVPGPLGGATPGHPRMLLVPAAATLSFPHPLSGGSAAPLPRGGWPSGPGQGPAPVAPSGARGSGFNVVPPAPPDVFAFGVNVAPHAALAMSYLQGPGPPPGPGHAQGLSPLSMGGVGAMNILGHAAGPTFPMATPHVSTGGHEVIVGLSPLANRLASASGELSPFAAPGLLRQGSRGPGPGDGANGWAAGPG